MSFILEVKHKNKLENVLEYGNGLNILSEKILTLNKSMMMNT